MDIDQAVLAEITRLRSEKNPPPTYRALAAEYLGDPALANTLRARVAEYQTRQRNAFVVPDVPPGLPGQYVHEFEQPLTLEDVPTLVLGDRHSPHTDIRLLRKALKLAEQSGVTRVVDNGDGTDATSVSSHRDALSTPLALDMAHNVAIMREFSERFTERVYVRGNHDTWMLDFYGMDYPEFVRHVDAGARATNYPYVLFGEDIVIGHMDRYDPVPGKLAYAIANKYKRHCLVNHDHLRGVYRPYITNNPPGYEWNGYTIYTASTTMPGKPAPYAGISIGAMCRLQNFAYKLFAFNDLPDSMQGFAIILPWEIVLYDGRGVVCDRIERGRNE